MPPRKNNKKRKREEDHKDEILTIVEKQAMVIDFLKKRVGNDGVLNMIKFSYYIV